MTDFNDIKVLGPSTFPGGVTDCVQFLTGSASWNFKNGSTNVITLNKATYKMGHMFADDSTGGSSVNGFAMGFSKTHNESFGYVPYWILNASSSLIAENIYNSGDIVSMAINGTSLEVKTGGYANDTYGTIRYRVMVWE